VIYDDDKNEKQKTTKESLVFQVCRQAMMQTSGLHWLQIDPMKLPLKIPISHDNVAK